MRVLPRGMPWQLQTFTLHVRMMLTGDYANDMMLPYTQFWIRHARTNVMFAHPRCCAAKVPDSNRLAILWPNLLYSGS